MIAENIRQKSTDPGAVLLADRYVQNMSDALLCRLHGQLHGAEAAFVYDLVQQEGVKAALDRVALKSLMLHTLAMATAAPVQLIRCAGAARERCACVSVRAG